MDTTWLGQDPRSGLLARVALHPVPLGLGLAMPARVPVVKCRGCPRSRPVVVEQLAGQVGIEEREATPLLDHLYLGYERFLRRSHSTTFEAVEELEIAVLDHV